MDEQEIDLRDYLRVLKKRWKLIVKITVGCALVSAVISFLLPKVYQAVALIEPAKIQKVPIETASSAELLFKNQLNPYLKEIAQKTAIKEKDAYSLAKNFDIKDKLGYLRISGKGKTAEESKRMTDLICELVVKRHSELMVDALKIADDDMNNMKKQFAFVKNEIEQLDKKLSQKEKADTWGQGYVFQGLITAKENALARQNSLEDKLRAKDMELKYYTKPAIIIAEATIPLKKIAPQKGKIVGIATFVGLMLSVFLVFVIEYFQKEPL